MAKNFFKSVFKKAAARENVQTEKDNDDFLEGFGDYMWMRPEREFRHHGEKYRFKSSNSSPLELGYVISTLFNIRKEEIATLTINDGTVTELKDPEEIWKYNLMSMYVDADTAEKPYVDGINGLINNVVLTLSYNTYEVRQKSTDGNSKFNTNGLIIIHLHTADGNRQKALYAQATFTLPTPRYARPFKGNHPQPESFSILMAHYIEDELKLTKEMEATLDSALDKLKEGKEMTYLERELLKEGMHFPESDIDFGTRALGENRYSDALYYFKSAFETIRGKWWEEKLKDKEFDLMAEAAYHTGYCYMELKQPGMAFRYLDFAYRIGNDHTHKYKMELINCFTSLGDIQSFGIVESFKNELYKKKVEEFTADDHVFAGYLFRREIYILIEFKQYKTAKEKLILLLETDPENEFALSELQYLKGNNLI